MEVFGLLEKCRNCRDDKGGYGAIIGMARARSHFAKTAPIGPAAAQQPLSRSSADKIGERHALDPLRGGCNFFEIAPEHSVAELIGDLEALDQPVAYLLIHRLALMSNEALTKPARRVAKRGRVEFQGADRL